MTQGKGKMVLKYRIMCLHLYCNRPDYRRLTGIRTQKISNLLVSVFTSLTMTGLLDGNFWVSDAYSSKASYKMKPSMMPSITLSDWIGL